MVLYIDSTDYHKIEYSLTNKGKITAKTYPVAPQESHRVLVNLEKFLKTAKISAKNLEKVVVCSGPGSYTGVRVGIVHAQAFGLAWNIPVIAVKKPKFKIPYL